MFCSEGVALSILMAGLLYRARHITSVNLINNDESYAPALLGISETAPLVLSSAVLSANQRVAGCLVV